ncbi:ABC-type transport auxiliary lipoprotein family protein [Phenylobacterium sp.]|jgi:uncharacterized lipoprotein YmbA|uniref:ABC-type transport auxiliary lipoprotein family protein n=1 Tax=Phenylobacterium sp. TaxID=1871053 RepID=UPI002E34AF16|nr:ABC-type transport auxiliary lipoprotein family protein [Phenylobacterium sp.]HEX3364177.1 ABC-type transport auxiliary lipoprotein family protein [Phenylobacterium sp.]
MIDRRWLAAGILALGLTACGTTPPTRYLTLAVAAPAQPGAGGTGLVLRPLDVRWPAALDRLEVARPTGGVEMAVDELTRWSAAPGRLAAAALTADLLARRPGAVIAPWSDPTPADAVAVTVQVETVSEQMAGYGLTAEISIACGPAPPRRWTFEAQADGAHDTQGEAQALSRLLAALADRIAGDLAC